MRRKNAHPYLPNYTDEQMRKLEQALPRVLAFAWSRFGNVSGFTAEDVAQEVYHSVLSGDRGRGWNAAQYPNPTSFLLRLVRYVGNDMVKKHKAWEPFREEHEHPTRIDSSNDAEENEIVKLVEEKEREIMEQIPDWKRISSYQQERVGGQRPGAKETAAALGMSIDHYYYVLNKCVKPARKAGEREILRKLGGR